MKREIGFTINDLRNIIIIAIINTNIADTIIYAHIGETTVFSISTKANDNNKIINDANMKQIAAIAIPLSKTTSFSANVNLA